MSISSVTKNSSGKIISWNEGDYAYSVTRDSSLSGRPLLVRGRSASRPALVTEFKYTPSGAFTGASGGMTSLMLGHLYAEAAGATSFSGHSQLGRAADRYKNKFRQGESRAFGVGDSWMAGNGASSLAKSTYGLTSTALASILSFGNYGLSGRPTHAYIQASLLSGAGAAKLADLGVLPDDLFFGAWGLNDLRGVNYGGASSGGCGNDPDNFASLATKAQSMAAWLMTPEAAKVRMHSGAATPNPSVTFAGTWNHGGYNGYSGFSFTQNNGSVSLATPKGNLLILFIGTDHSSNGAFSVTVDGVVVANGSSVSSYDAWSLDCMIVPLRTNSMHNVTITHTGGDVTMLDSVACVDTTTDFSATLLYSGPGYLQDAAGSGWSESSGAANGIAANSITGASKYLYGNGGCDRFSDALSSAMDKLFNLGFNVANTQARVGFNASIHITPATDSVHPNDPGHAHLANGFIASIGGMIA